MNPRLAVAVLGLLLAGCSGPASTPPSVLAVSPADEAVGVLPGARLTVSFSQPMNPVAVENAYASTSEGLRRSQVSFSWNANDTQLTVTPAAPLAVVDAPAAALSYGFVLTAAATDQTGKALPELSVRFSTARRYRLLAPGLAGASGTTSSHPGDFASGVNFAGGSPARVGGASYLIAAGGSATLSTRGFLTFDLSALPAGVVGDAVQSASLSLSQKNVFPATAYTDMTTADEKLVLEHVSFGASLTPAAYDAPALSTVTPAAFSDSNLSSKSISVADAVRDDLAHRDARGSLTQYRLRFPKDTPEGNYGFAEFGSVTDSASPATLEVRYLAP
ncbi:MAG TPA: Ig-like domain-containing protein [Deinococcales bacterium]|nr:Ig-like domain-containing protein [Deinococcales bacterium]